MRYNYIISTGNSTITGSQLDISSRNQQAYSAGGVFEKTHFRQAEDGSNKNYPFSLDTNIITGNGVSLISLNSQTMLEATGITIESVGRRSYYIQADDDLGDYIIDFNNGEGEIMFDPVLNLDQKDFIYYDKRDFATGISISHEGGDINFFPFGVLTVDELRVKVNAAYSNAATQQDFFENYDVFLNGQKLEESDYPDATVTGSLFAIPKKDRIIEIYSNEPDVFGSGFVENHVDFYINGMEQTTEDFLQIYTGVYMIEAGIDSSVYFNHPKVENY